MKSLGFTGKTDEPTTAEAAGGKAGDEEGEPLRPSSECPTEGERRAYERAQDYLHEFTKGFDQTDLDCLTTLILEERKEAHDAGFSAGERAERERLGRAMQVPRDQRCHSPHCHAEHCTCKWSAAAPTPESPPSPSEAEAEPTILELRRIAKLARWNSKAKSELGTFDDVSMALFNAGRAFEAKAAKERG